MDSVTAKMVRTTSLDARSASMQSSSSSRSLKDDNNDTTSDHVHERRSVDSNRG